METAEYVKPVQVNDQDNFTHCFGVFIADFERVNTGWVVFTFQVLL